MYSIVKGIFYSTINSFLNMSSLCDHWPERTTASNKRVKGLGTGWNANTQTYLKLFDYQSAPPALEDKNKKACKIMQPFKRKENKQALSYFLASTWQNWMKRREGERVWHFQFQACRGKRPYIPHSLSLPLPAAGAESKRDWLSCWLGTSGFFLQYSDPLHLPHTLHFSPTVLSFQLTKHLT